MYIMRTIQLPMNLLSFTVLAKTFAAVLISLWDFIYRFHCYILKIQWWRLLYLCNQGLYTVATSIPSIDLANKHFYLHVLYDLFRSLSPFSKQNNVFLYVLNAFSKVIIVYLHPLMYSKEWNAPQLVYLIRVPILSSLGRLINLSLFLLH